MENDIDPSTAGEDNDPASEIASLRERLLRALAETENTRRQGERLAQDAQRYAITNFARELLQVVDGFADMQTGVGIGRGPLHNVGREEGSHAR